MQLHISNNTLRLDTAFGAVLRCDDAFPMLTVGRVAGMTHANYPRESWIPYDEFLTKFSKTEDGKLLYMGKHA